MTIFIPTPLRPFAEGKDSVQVSASTVAACLEELTQTYPALRKHLFTQEGKVRAFVNLYLNDEDRAISTGKGRKQPSLPMIRCP